MSESRLLQHRFARASTRASERGLAAILAGFWLTACASGGAPSSQPGQTISGVPVVSTTASGAPLITVPLGSQGSGRPAQIVTAGPGASASVDGAALDTRFRQIDDHYSRAAAETRQLVQQAIAAMKQTPSAADVAALKATVGRLEAQVTRLTTATTRTEGSLAGLTSRIQVVERAQTERAAEATAAASPSPPPGFPKSEAARPPVDPADAGFTEALAALNGPKEATEPIRTWLELYPTHPKAAEGYLQLGFQFLNRNYPVAAAYYFKRVVSDYPMTLQAKEAQAILSSIPLPDAPKPRVSPKKAIKPSTPASHKAAPTGPSATPPAVRLPELTRREPETPAPLSPGATAPAQQGDPRSPSGVTGRGSEGLLAPPPAEKPPTGPPLKPAPPARPHVEEKL